MSDHQNPPAPPRPKTRNPKVKSLTAQMNSLARDGGIGQPRQSRQSMQSMQPTKTSTNPATKRKASVTKPLAEAGSKRPKANPFVHSDEDESSSPVDPKFKVPTESRQELQMKKSRLIDEIERRKEKLVAVERKLHNLIETSPTLRRNFRTWPQPGADAERPAVEWVESPLGEEIIGAYRAVDDPGPIKVSPLASKEVQDAAMEDTNVAAGKAPRKLNPDLRELMLKYFCPEKVTYKPFVQHPSVRVLPFHQMNAERDKRMYGDGAGHYRGSGEVDGIPNHHKSHIADGQTTLGDRQRRPVLRFRFSRAGDPRPSRGGGA